MQPHWRDTDTENEISLTSSYVCLKSCVSFLRPQVGSALCLIRSTLCVSSEERPSPYCLYISGRIVPIIGGGKWHVESQMDL